MSVSALILRADAAALPLADESVQCEFTSPPYNVGVNYDGYDDVRPWADYWADVDRWTAEMYRVAAPGCRSWINVAPVVQEEPGGHGRNGPHSGRSLKTRQSLIAGWSTRMEAAGFQPADIVAWTSQRGSGTAWGSWQSPSAPNLRGDWEAVLVYFKGSWVRTPPPGYEGWKDKLGNWPALASNVWTLRPETRNGHPAPFPVELAARAIRLSTWPGESVLDAFCGGGSTLRAAKDLGRRGIGVEQSARYCVQASEKAGQEVLAL